MKHVRVMLVLVAMLFVPTLAQALPPNFSLVEAEERELRHLPEQSAKYWTQVTASGGVGLIDFGPWYLKEGGFVEGEYTRLNFVADFIEQNPQLGVDLSNFNWDELGLVAGVPYWFPLPESSIPSQVLAQLETQTADVVATPALQSPTDESAPPAWTLSREEFDAVATQLATATTAIEGLKAQVAALEPGIDEATLNNRLAALRDELLAGQVTEDRVSVLVAEQLEGYVKTETFSALQEQVNGQSAQIATAIEEASAAKAVVTEVQAAQEAVRNLAQEARAEAAAAAGAVNALSTQLASKADVETVANLTERVVTTETGLSAANTRIDGLVDDVSATQTAVEAQATALANLKTQLFDDAGNLIVPEIEVLPLLEEAGLYIDGQPVVDLKNHPDLAGLFNADGTIKPFASQAYVDEQLAGFQDKLLQFAMFAGVVIGALLLLWLTPWTALWSRVKSFTPQRQQRSASTA